MAKLLNKFEIRIVFVSMGSIADLRQIKDGLVKSVAKAAVSCGAWVGKQDGSAADMSAVKAIEEVLESLDAKICVKIGEGERDEAPMLYSGQVLGKEKNVTHKKYTSIDIAVDPLEGTNACKSNLPDSLSVICANLEGKIINAPDVYMNKLATAIEVPNGTLDIQKPIEQNILNLASLLQIPVAQLVICILERERNKELVERAKYCGANVQLIQDGDVLAILKTHQLFGSQVHLYAGIGGAPEGVLAASFIEIVNGFFQGCFCAYNKAQELRLQDYKISKARIYSAKDLVGEDSFFCISFVTDGLLKGPVKVDNSSKWRVNVFHAAKDTPKKGVFEVVEV